MSGKTLSTDDVVLPLFTGTALRQGDESLHLGVAWCVAEPGRIGQVIPIEEGGSWVGRAGAKYAGDPDAAAPFLVQRPGRSTPLEPIVSPAISRHQLRVEPLDRERLSVLNVGKRKLRHNGVATTQCIAKAGDTLRIDDVMLLLVERRPRELLPLAYPVGPEFAFGGPDANGMVGESPAAWALRDQLVAAAMTDGHVLITGETGTGKEMAARAIHALSKRRSGPFLRRNAAAIPAGLLDAELFGHARNYPDAGMPEREGLFAAAHGGRLWLDEIGEMLHANQAHLLLVMDAEGEFQRLGETRHRYADVRIIATTNRPPNALKHDFLARFGTRLTVSGLNERRSDIPLLIRHWLDRLTPERARRFRCDLDPPRPAVELALVDELVRHHYTAHTRELERLLELALAGSRGECIALTSAVLEALREAGTAERREAGTAERREAGTVERREAGTAERREAPATVRMVDPARSQSTLPPPAYRTNAQEPRRSREQVVAALEATGGTVSHAAELLGVSRFSLHRMILRYRIS